MERLSAHAVEVNIRVVLANDFLPKVDIGSMRNSLEVRVPMLDEELIDFGLTLLAKLRGAQRANVLLDAAASNAQWSKEGAAFARIELNRGRLHELGGRRAEARRCFGLAQTVSRSQGLDALRRRSEAALARLA